MKIKSSLICIFVKTPGHSAVKTRLKLDQSISDKIFTLSALSTGKEVDILSSERISISATWHVAEEDEAAREFWPVHNEQRWFISKQEGSSLAEKLHNAYSSFIKDYDSVIFLAADTPLIQAKHITRCFEQLEQSDFFLGPADDGGFYLFGGSKEIPESIWDRVPYSDSSTCSRLVEELKEIGSVSKGASLSDIDYMADVSLNIAELEKRKDLNIHSKELLEYLKKITQERELRDASL